MIPVIAISSLNDQHGCRSVYISALDDSQLSSMSSESMHMYLSSSIANLISSATMQSGISMQGSFALIVMHMPGISSSLFCFVVVSG